MALNAKTGEVVWEKKVEDYTGGYYMTLAPLVAKGKVQVGVSGGEFGIRGFVAAYDANTGDEVWKTYTIPGPGEPGHDTWSGDKWKTGGASVWITGSYDPELNQAYWGTGNGAQWMGDSRPGDNLYANSVLALDADTGAIKGYHQYHHNESWDWDEVSAPLLLDVPKNGNTIKALIHPGRNGYLWTLERKADGIKFVDAKPYVKQDVFSSIDPETGRPSYHEDKKPAMNKKADFCPSLWGGKDWPPAAYSPKTGYLYIPANENLCGALTGQDNPPYVRGQLWLGVEIKDIVMTVREDADHIGELQAWDMKTGEKAWTHNFKYHNWGPVLATGGDLIFAGGTNDRYFRAFDAKTGSKLWEYRTNSGITAVPVTYEVDGVQYVSVQSGWGVDAQRMQNRVDKAYGFKTDVPQGGVIWTFTVR